MPPIIIHKMPSWLRLPSEPEYTERGGVKEMDEYLAAKKHKEEERGKKRVEEHGWGMVISSQ
jgi:hypothetical protein